MESLLKKAIRLQKKWNETEKSTLKINDNVEIFITPSGKYLRERRNFWTGK